MGYQLTPKVSKTFNNVGGKLTKQDIGWPTYPTKNYFAGDKQSNLPAFRIPLSRTNTLKGGAKKIGKPEDVEQDS